VYIVRAQLFTAFYFKKSYPGLLPVVAINILVLSVTSAITISGMHISDVLRFTGAFCALVCVYGIPAVVQWRQKRPARWKRRAVLVGLLAIGFGNLILQFVAPTS
jgi:sodium-coupled neutral amino acid transporter 9